MVLSFEALLFFVFLSLGASTVNGALGYGFSSLSIPLAILLLPNRVLNPAFVPVEVLLNGAIVFFDRRQIRATFSRSFPVIISLLPGVLFGSYLLKAVSPLPVRFFLYAVLLPLVLLQAAGVRRPLDSERVVKLPFGVALGTVYSLTTISGPPLALFWNNQGLAKGEFRATLAQIRLAEGVYTAMAYYFLGLYSPLSIQISGVLFPPILVGIPLGRLIVNTIRVETFQRICMSFDAWIIGYGLSRTLIDLSIGGPSAYTVWAGVALVDTWLLYRFFSRRRGGPEAKRYAERISR